MTGFNNICVHRVVVTGLRWRKWASSHRTHTHTHTYTYIIIIIIISSSSSSIGIQPLGRSGQRPEFSQATGIALIRCILGKFLGVACHCFPPLFRCFHFSPPGASTSATTWEFPVAEVGTVGGMLFGNFAEMTTYTPFRDLLHAAYLRHGTDGFTFPPSEGK